MTQSKVLLRTTSFELTNLVPIFGAYIVAENVLDNNVVHRHVDVLLKDFEKTQFNLYTAHETRRHQRPLI